MYTHDFAYFVDVVYHYMYTTTIYIIYIKRRYIYAQSVQSVHSSKKSVHKSVHKVFIQVFILHVNLNLRYNDFSFLRFFGSCKSTTEPCVILFVFKISFFLKIYPSFCRCLSSHPKVSARSL